MSNKNPNPQANKFINIIDLFEMNNDLIVQMKSNLHILKNVVFHINPVNITLLWQKEIVRIRK
jgi:hypothetical protein